MPKIKHFVFAALIGIVLLVAIALVSMGIFKPVSISQTEYGPLKLLYKDHVGVYHKIMTAIEEVETYAKSAGLVCAQSFGLYQDDPAVVEHARLRSRGGCVIAEGETVPAQLPEGISVQEIPRAKFLQAVYEGSPRIGPLKVYPKMLGEIEEKKLTTAKWGVIEIYDIQKDSIKTTYLFPLEN